MTKVANLIGQRFGRLTVVERDKNLPSGKAQWKCYCDCGGETITTTYRLRSGKTQSCGCIALEKITELNKGKSLSIDLKGTRYGRLKVIDFSHFSKDKKRTFWKCRCDCGSEVIVRADQLKNGHTKSCGCYNKDVVRNGRFAVTHDKSKTRIYHIYTGMKTRCYNPNCSNYKDYGGRGIGICKEWLDDFQKFYDWAVANGYEDDLSIDRINPNGDYSPSNCRWATDIEQMNNTRRNHYISHNGERKSLKQWSEDIGFSYEKVKARMARGIPFEKAIID